MGLVKSFYLLNNSVTDNEVVDIFKSSNDPKSMLNVFANSFYLNPFALLNKINFNDKNRIFSFNCDENMFLMEQEYFSPKVKEKSLSFFGSFLKTFSSEEKKNPEKKVSKNDTSIKVKGVMVLERFRFRETLLGMGNVDLFLFLIESIAFSPQFTDPIYW